MFQMATATDTTATRVSTERALEPAVAGSVAAPSEPEVEDEGDEDEDEEDEAELE